VKSNRRTSKNWDDLMAGSRELYAAAKKLLNDEDDKIQALQKEQKALNESYRKNSGTVEARTLSENHEQLFDSVETLKDQIHTLELEAERAKVPPSKDKIIEAQAYLANADKKLSEANAYVENKAALMVEDQEMLKVLDYWNMAFSPYGIPNMILREVIAPLNKEARRVSAAMTGGTIDVRYSTTKELASGLEKAQLNIEVDNKLGDKDLSGSSKGEAGLTNIIISETLSEIGQVGQRMGFKWLDEVVPHQDPLVCNSLYSYMRDMAQKQGILIFLVDHNPAAANYADHVLVVEKKANPEVHCVVRWKQS
jgi:DNA repair exonuclease SbcCD ATPase subunit